LEKNLLPSDTSKKDMFFYGWVVTLAGMVISLVGLGIRYSFGVFFKSIEGDFVLTRAATSGIFSANMVLAGFVSLLGGRASDRYGPKIVMFIMGVFIALSLIVTSRVSASWQLYLTYSFLFALGTGAIFPATNATVTRWFDRRRGFALGIASAGGSIGAVVMAPLATVLISSYQWRTACIILGAVVGLIVIGNSLLMKKDPSDLGLLPDGVKPQDAALSGSLKIGQSAATGLTLSQAVKTANFWMLGTAWLLLSVNVHMILTHSVPHAIDLGILPMDASVIVSLIGAGSFLGRITGGKLSDTYGRIAVGAVAALLQAAVLVWLIWMHDLWSLYLFALAFGFTWGGLGINITASIGDLFGMRSLGSIMGTLVMWWSIGAAVGPAVGGYIFDVTGSYRLAFAIDAGVIVIAAFFFFLIKQKPGPKIG
jgi:MFS family permease